MAATLTEAQTIRADATFQGRVRVAMGITARNILNDGNQSQGKRQFAYQCVTKPDAMLTGFLDYVAARTDLLAATQAGTSDANIQTACDAALPVLCTSV